MVKWYFICSFFACVLVVHLRGRIRQSFWGQVFDHSGLLAPVNVLLYAFSAVPNRPYLSLNAFPELAGLRHNAQVIRAEAINLQRLAGMRVPDRNDDAGFNSFAKSGWSRFYLKWYDVAHPSAARLCPRTTELLQSLPSVKAAMFAELPPGAVLNPHRDPYAGSLRYHLGLVTPNDDRCFIKVDGIRYSWRDNEDVLFDESFIHTAENRTEVSRLILFCDVERPLKFGVARAFNRWFARHVVAQAASPNEPGDQVGIVNRLSFISFRAGALRRRFKSWNRTAYATSKAALLIAAVALFVWVV
jgi:beta-hydroxylase